MPEHVERPVRHRRTEVGAPDAILCFYIKDLLLSLIEYICYFIRTKSSSNHVPYFNLVYTFSSTICHSY